MPTAHELVERGAQMLDEKLPGWADQIDLERLDMSHGCHCVLGQIGTEVFNLDSSWDMNTEDPSPFIVIENKFGIDSEMFGFDVETTFMPDDYDAALAVAYDELRDAWKGAITARRTL